MFMEQETKPVQKSSSTRLNKTNLKDKYARKSQENVLNGDKIKIRRFKEKDAEKLKEKYSVQKSDAQLPFDKEFLDSVKGNNENKMETDTTTKTPEDEEIVSPKVNVFQFMMNSRHKVIGSNSSGKDKKPEPEKMPEEMVEKKEKTKKRKAALGEWAEKKGGQKRKLADEAQEEHIKKTLKERAKRLKKMLEIIDEDLRNSSHDESDHEIKSSTKEINKKSDKNEKFTLAEVDESCENKIDTPDEKTNNSKPNLRKSKDFDDKKNIESKEKVQKTPIIRPKRNKKSSTNNLEVGQEKIKTNENETETPKRRVTRKQINSKLGQNKLEQDQINIDNTSENNKNNHDNFNRTESNENQKDSKENENQEVPKENENQEVSKEIDNQEVSKEIENEENSQQNENQEEPNKIKSTKNVKKSIGNLSLKKNKKSITPEAEKKTENNKSTILSNDDNEDIFPVNTPKSNKKSKQLKLFQDSNTKPVEEEIKSFTPRSWKMKVRLFEKENINEEINDDVDSVIVVDDKESPKKPQLQVKISNFFGSTTSPSKSASEKKDVKIAPLFLKQQSKKPTKAEVEAKKKFLYSGMPEQVKKVAARQQR